MNIRASIIALFVSVATLVLVVTDAYCQNALPLSNPPQKKNALGVTMSLHEFFDGNAVMQLKYRGRQGWTNLQLGLEYGRTIGTKSAL